MILQLRIVKLQRQATGSLGISLKGGTDHNLPILVSKVCRNEDDDHLYIGDAIVKVNHTLLTSVSHEEAINILNNAGGEVTLTVKHYKSAAPFLLKNFRQLIPEQDHFSDKDSGRRSSGASSGVDGNQNTSKRHQPLESPCSVTSDGSSTNWNGIPRVRRKWVDVVEVPLLLAYITRYIYGTDKLRPNAFEVRGLNGSNTGVIQCTDLAVLSHWIKLISDYISALASQKV